MAFNCPEFTVSESFKIVFYFIFLFNFSNCQLHSVYKMPSVLYHFVKSGDATVDESPQPCAFRQTSLLALCSHHKLRVLPYECIILLIKLETWLIRVDLIVSLIVYWIVSKAAQFVKLTHINSHDSATLFSYAACDYLQNYLFVKLFCTSSVVWLTAWFEMVFLRNWYFIAH